MNSRLLWEQGHSCYYLPGQTVGEQVGFKAWQNICEFTLAHLHILHFYFQTLITVVVFLITHTLYGRVTCLCNIEKKRVSVYICASPETEAFHFTKWNVCGNRRWDWSFTEDGLKLHLCFNLYFIWCSAILKKVQCVRLTEYNRSGPPPEVTFIH